MSIYFFTTNHSNNNRKKMMTITIAMVLNIIPIFLLKQYPAILQTLICALIRERELKKVTRNITTKI